MAKFNIEIELDWLYEDGIDEVIKAEVVKSIENNITKKIEDEVYGAIRKKVSENTENTINEKLKEYMNDFMEKEFEQVDRWGDVQKITNPKDRLKEMLDKFLKDKVDNQGRLITTTYGDGQNRLEYILNKTAKEHIAKYQKGISDQVLEGIKEDINKETQERVVKSILSDYDLKKLIGKA